jgi:DNA-binding GntR family transcriptional regulator
MATEAPDYRLALDSRQSKPLPEQVEQEILRLIQMQAPGFRVNDLFQVQDIARANRISRNTVTPAVKRLEQMGILDFTHKNGYRVLKAQPTIQIPVREDLPLSMGDWAQLHDCLLQDAFPFAAEEIPVGVIEAEAIRKTIRELLLLDDEKHIVLIRRIRFLIHRSDPNRSIPMYEEAYVRADALPNLGRDFNQMREIGGSSFSLFGYYYAHLKTKIRASHYYILADSLPRKVQPVWDKEVRSHSISSHCHFTRLDTVNFTGPTDVSPLEKGGSLQYGREYYPSPYFRFQAANRDVSLTFG